MSPFPASVAGDTEQPVADGERLVEDLGGELASLERAGRWVVGDRPDAYRERIRELLENWRLISHRGLVAGYNGVRPV